MVFCLLYDKVILKCEEVEIKLVGGIVLIGFVVIKFICGKVIVVGIGCLLENGNV